MFLRSTEAYWAPAANSRAGCVRPERDRRNGQGDFEGTVVWMRTWRQNCTMALHSSRAYIRHPSVILLRPSMGMLSPGSLSPGGSCVGQLGRLAFGILAALTVAGRRRVRTASAPIESGFLAEVWT